MRKDILIRPTSQELGNIATDQLQKVRVRGVTISLPLKTLLSLPEIVKLEVQYPLFSKSDKQIETLNLICDMTGVKFDVSTKEGRGEKRRIGGQWVSFCMKYQLTAPEIIEAYRMGLSKEFETVKIFPNLSLITAGEVLKAYREFKHRNSSWKTGQKLISGLINPESEEPEEVRFARRQKMWNDLLLKVRNNESCIFAGHFYSELDSKGCFKNLTAHHKNVLIRLKMIQILTKEIRKGKSVHFTMNEAMKLLNDLEMDRDISHDFLRGLAIQQVKDDLVFNYLKENNI